MSTDIHVAPGARLFAMHWLLVSASLLLTACNRHEVAAVSPAVPAAQALNLHSAEFRKEIVKVTDGVYVAVGYGIANSIMLEGPDGLVIVDTLSSRESAQAVLAEFRKISSKPIRALIFTHSHPDHIGGAETFFDEAGGKIPVYGQQGIVTNVASLAGELEPVLTRRAQRMYGTPLPAQDLINVGIGPALDLEDGRHVAFLLPDHTFNDQLTVDIAGLHLQLVHAPGETEDQLFVWMPDKRVLLSGDNLYRAFPNLYTIRGTTYRDPKRWAASLDMMRALKPAFLVPSHTRPISGEQTITTLLTDYGDGIRYVYQQTIRLMNQGLGPEEIAHRIQLPPRLAANPWLQAYYGKVSWSAKSIFAGQVGWFDGNPAHLQPLAPTDEARHMVALAGGQASMDRQITEAAQRGEHQWVLQLSDYALVADPADAQAKAARVAALKALAEAETNANARNYYLTAMYELEDGLKLKRRLSEPTPGAVATLPLSVFFDGIAVNLDAEAAADVRRAVAFEFPESGEAYTLFVRDGVAEVQKGVAPEAEVVVRMQALAFKELLAGLRNPVLGIANDMTFERGGRVELGTFMKMFRPINE